MRRAVPCLGLCLLTLVAACTRGDAGDTLPPHESSKLAAPAREDGSRSLSEPGELRAVVAAGVEGYAGPDGRPFEIALRTVPEQLGHTRRFGKRTLEIALRAGTRQLSQYPCKSCHMGRKLVLERERVEDAHTNVQPVHPRETGMTCGTCHAAENVELLAVKTDEHVTLDHAYRMCAQCHSPQVEAWSNGAHGKRLDGWQGRRVVMNCTDCHDPHAPALRERLPFRAPRLHRREK